VGAKRVSWLEAELQEQPAALARLIDKQAGQARGMRVLEASGLVRSEKVGRVRTCRIEPAALSRAEQWISERRTGWERRLDRLGDYLAGEPEDTNQGRKP